jgi:hypothetical protein
MWKFVREKVRMLMCVSSLVSSRGIIICMPLKLRYFTEMTWETNGVEKKKLLLGDTTN